MPPEHHVENEFLLHKELVSQNEIFFSLTEPQFEVFEIQPQSQNVFRQLIPAVHKQYTMDVIWQFFALPQMSKHTQPSLTLLSYKDVQFQQAQAMRFVVHYGSKSHL